MKFLIFIGVLCVVNCQNGDVFEPCDICDYEKPTVEDGCIQRLKV